MEGGGVTARLVCNYPSRAGGTQLKVRENHKKINYFSSGRAPIPEADGE